MAPDAGATKPHKHPHRADKAVLTCPAGLPHALTLGRVNGEITRGSRPSENGQFTPTHTASLPAGTQLTLLMTCSCHLLNTGSPVLGSSNTWAV